MSLTRTFTPQTDLDWSAITSDDEYESLYPTVSLLSGTGVDHELDAFGRATYVKYQQMNLMTFTGLLERHGIRVLALMYDLDDSQPFTEYLGNFLKEEVYHYTMFDRAVRSASMTHTWSTRITTRPGWQRPRRSVPWPTPTCRPKKSAC
jgi:P-aminobenzoate N-oxygenase AurF